MEGEGGGWVHPKGTNSTAMSWLTYEQPLVGAGQDIKRNLESSPPPCIASNSSVQGWFLPAGCTLCTHPAVL